MKLSVRTIAIGVILFLESAYYSSADVEPFLLVVAFILMVLDIRDFSQLSKLSKQIDSLGEEKPYEGKIRKTSPVYAESEKLNSVQDKVRESVEQQIQSERLNRACDKRFTRPENTADFYYQLYRPVEENGP